MEQNEHKDMLREVGHHYILNIPFAWNMSQGDPRASIPFVRLDPTLKKQLHLISAAKMVPKTTYFI